MQYHCDCDISRIFYTKDFRSLVFSFLKNKITFKRTRLSIRVGRCTLNCFRPTYLLCRETTTEVKYSPEGLQHVYLHPLFAYHHCICIGNPPAGSNAAAHFEDQKCLGKVPCKLEKIVQLTMPSIFWPNWRFFGICGSLPIFTVYDKSVPRCFLVNCQIFDTKGDAVNSRLSPWQPVASWIRDDTVTLCITNPIMWKNYMYKHWLSFLYDQIGHL